MTTYRIIKLESHKHTEYAVYERGWFNFWREVKLYHPDGFAKSLRFDNYEEAEDWVLGQNEPKRTVVKDIEVRHE